MFCRKYVLLITLLTSLVFSQKKIACIGNSITSGYGLPNPITESFPSQLQQLLGSGYIVFNYGYSGAVLLNNFPLSYINSPIYNPSISQHYDLIIITLGTNDTQQLYHPAIDNFISDYKALINKYDNFPSQDPPICIIGIPPPISPTWSLSRSTYLIEQVIPRIQSMASQTNNSIANFYNALKDKEYLFIDGKHPNVEGAYIMALTAKSAIDKVLSPPPPPPSPPPPSTPNNFSANGDNGQVTLTWDANFEMNIINYIIYRGTVDGGWKDVLVFLDKDMTSYVDKNVNNYTPYYYQICAYNTYNKVSDRSNQISTTPIPDTTPPLIPNNFTAIASQGMITLSWNANTEIDLHSYHLFKGTVDGGAVNYFFSVGKNTTNYSDNIVTNNTTYYYKIKAADTSDNQSGFSNQATVTTLSVLTDYLQTEYSLNQNTPNPFNPNTVIEFSLPTDIEINIVIYDLMGNEVKTLINEFKPVGQYSVNWDGRDNAGQSVSGGIYFYQLQIDGFVQTRKMVLLK